MDLTTVAIDECQLSSQQCQLAKALSLHLQIANKEQISRSCFSSSALQQRIAIFNEIMNDPTNTTPQQPELSFDVLLPILDKSKDPRIKKALDMVRMSPKIWEAIAAEEIWSWKARHMAIISR